MASLRDEEAVREVGGVAPCLSLGAVLLFDKGVVKTPSSSGAPLY